MLALRIGAIAAIERTAVKCDQGRDAVAIRKYAVAAYA